jgi:hypothetical protein
LGNLVKQFKLVVPFLNVESVWLIRKKNEGDGFQGWHRDMVNNATSAYTIVVNLGAVEVKAVIRKEVAVASGDREGRNESDDEVSDNEVLEDFENAMDEPDKEESDMVEEGDPVTSWSPPSELGNKQVHLIDVTGDGNCLFYCLLQGDNLVERVKDLRLNLMNYLNEKRHEPSPSGETWEWWTKHTIDINNKEARKGHQKGWINISSFEDYTKGMLHATPNSSTTQGGEIPWKSCYMQQNINEMLLCIRSLVAYIRERQFLVVEHTHPVPQTIGSSYSVKEIITR